LEELIDEYPEQFLWRSIDITDSPQISDYLRYVRKRFGHVTHLINSAGIAPEGLVTMMKSSDVRKLFQVNVEGAHNLTRLCVKQMMVKQSGVVVNVSSIVGRRGYKGVGAYSATKAALDGLTRGLARELGGQGIRVNSVAPGFMETEMTNQLTEKQKQRIIRLTPLERLGKVDDVADTVTFLCSEKARFMTGQTLVVDGGFTV